MGGDRFGFLPAEPLSYITLYFIVLSSFQTLFHTLSGLSLTLALQSKQSPPQKWRTARSFMIGELFSLWPGITLSWSPSTSSGSSPGGPSSYRECSLLFLKTAEANLPNELGIPQSKSSKFHCQNIFISPATHAGGDESCINSLGVSITEEEGPHS